MPKLRITVQIHWFPYLHYDQKPYLLCLLPRTPFFFKSPKLDSFFDDPTDVGNFTSGSSAFSKTSLKIWKFMVHVLLKPVLENFEHYFASVWDECNCAVVWAFFGIQIKCLSLGLEWKLTFSSPVPTAEFSKFAGILSAALSQHHLSGLEIAQLEFHHLH